MRDHLRDLVAELPRDRLAAMLRLLSMVSDDEEFVDWQGGGPGRTRGRVQRGRT